jgi:hypothetical protein
MEIDLSNANDLTLESVKCLVASGTDDTDTQLRVTSNGVVFLSKTVGNIDIDGLAFRLETWIAGNGYVGKAAAEDLEWVEKIYECVKNNWPNPNSTYIDYI